MTTSQWKLENIDHNNDCYERNSGKLNKNKIVFNFELFFLDFGLYLRTFTATQTDVWNQLPPFYVEISNWKKTKYSLCMNRIRSTLPSDSALFSKQILFSDRASFSLNGYLSNNNCRICDEEQSEDFQNLPLHLDK